MTPRDVTAPASPNHSARRGGLTPALIVIHYTGMGSLDDARARLCDPAAEVSAHWLIAPDGTTEALVPENLRAWHAGAGSWRGLGDINSRSIGIELHNPGDRPFPQPQMQALEALLPAIMARWNIPAQGVIAHSDMAPDRKADPGPRFDWGRLARQGLALAPHGLPEPPGPLAPMLDRIGYPPCDEGARLAAFRLRFCPWNRGPENELDRRTAAGVLAALPAPDSALPVYKVLRADEWATLQAQGETAGAPVDLADGYVHLSTAAQLPETLGKHFAGGHGLQLLACDAAALGPALRWEPSRKGALFPHLYRPLRLADLMWHRPLSLGPDGHHQTGEL